MTSIEDAIILCFFEVDRNELSFGDLKFLLLSKELKRYNTKLTKKKYISWEKKLKKKFGWKEPYKSFTFGTSYLHKKISEMVSKGKLIRTSEGHYRLTHELSWRLVYKIRDKRDIDIFIPSLILNERDLTLYGFHLVNYITKCPDELKEVFENMMNTYNLLLKKFEDIERILSSFNYYHFLFYLKDNLNNIEKQGYNKKEKKLAYKYLEGFFRNIDSDVDGFKFIKDKKNNKILVYIPKNYYFSKKLSSLISDITDTITLFYMNKTIVYTPDGLSLKPEETLQFKNTIKDIHKCILKKLKKILK